MTPEKLIEQCELAIRWAKSVQAGEPIKVQHKAYGFEMNWSDSPPAWDIGSFEYREKPKPIERFLVLNESNDTVGVYGATYKELAENFAKRNGLRVVHMREVVE